MYCDKENVNILTALLIAHGVRHAVVCPGSRNAPITHNLGVCEDIECHPVTDERSAAFYALGLCQATHSPVVVCVTSGTALLNTLPAVAEAMYQHLPLVVISADRPRQWIGQLDGQTLPQADAMGRFVRFETDIPEPHDDETRWMCSRLVNEAMLEAMRGSCAPVHINVPISEPLYSFTTPSLPKERQLTLLSPLSLSAIEPSVPCARPMLERLQTARRPLIVIGQMGHQAPVRQAIGALEAARYVVLHEPLATEGGSFCLDEMLILAGDDDEYVPDFILYMGDTFVSKRAKQFLRKALEAECWLVNPEGAVHDTFKNLHGVVQAQPGNVLRSITGKGPEQWFDAWQGLRDRARSHRDAFLPSYSNVKAVRLLEQKLARKAPRSVVHYANSTPVRLACLYSRHHIYCNRGVNGIEGTLSTAAGFSLATAQMVACVIGDLSFFYDQNALWNARLRGNLRILLLNNGGGEIFAKFSGLRQSPARDMVMGANSVTAEGICRQNNIAYMAVKSNDGLAEGIDKLVTMPSDRPVLLEVCTQQDMDLQVYHEYFKTL